MATIGRAAGLATLITTAALATGCPPLDGVDNECTVDGECGGGEVCANTQECLPGTEVRRVELTWTIGGVAPPNDLSVCAGLALAADFTIPGATRPRTYQPIGCGIGRITFDKMPVEYTSVTVRVVAGSETVWTQVEPLAGPLVTIALDISPPPAPVRSRSDIVR